MRRTLIDTIGRRFSSFCQREEEPFRGLLSHDCVETKPQQTGVLTAGLSLVEVRPVGFVFNKYLCHLEASSILGWDLTISIALCVVMKAAE